MNMKQSCKALICAIEGELDGRHCTEEQAAAILDHAVPSLTEALARVEAERQEWTLLTMDTMIQRDTAKAQLAEAVGLLDQLTSTGCWDVSNSDLVDRARDIWMEHRDAKLSNAKGAQAEPANFGQELEAFEKWRHTQADSLRRCGYPDGADAFIRLGSVQWAGWQARASLATQPAPAAEHSAYDTLVDSIGAHPTREQLNELYREHHAGHPADFALDVLERWGPRPAVRGAEHE